MKVKSPFYFWISVLLVPVLVYFFFDRANFVRNAQRTLGTVERVIGWNSTCGSKGSRHDCTKFQAAVSYRVNGTPYAIGVTAGSVRGHNQPITHAEHRVGQSVPVVYDARKPTRAYRDDPWGIWGPPIATFCVQIFAFLASFAEKRGNDWTNDRSLAPLRVRRTGR